MMSPSFPLKVDAGGLSPQPDTPDTPVTPYLSSPDEVTATWGWMRPVAWNQALHPQPMLRPKPAPILIGLPWQNPPPTLTACRQHELTFSVHLTLLYTNTHTPIDSRTLYHDCESAPKWNFKNLKIRVNDLCISTYKWLITLTNHQNKTETLTPGGDHNFIKIFRCFIFLFQSLLCKMLLVY